MRIAFVGKGGAGKTTASTLFAQYLSQTTRVVAIDADINMHMAELLTGDRPGKKTLISEKEPSTQIRDYIRGTNSRIDTAAHIKKTTPPGSGSRLFDLTKADDWLLSHFSTQVTDTLSLLTVGSYSEEGVASSCYHNNLSVLENVLTHTIDTATIVTDMVAGTDAFANTLYSQFDMLVFVLEPTTRSATVLDQYRRLAKHAGVGDRLFVIGNKVEDESDLSFVHQVTADDVLLGTLSRSRHLLEVDKGRVRLNVTQMAESDKAVFEAIASLLKVRRIPMQDRLPELWRMHKVYVVQSYVADRFGDLTHQIDANFTYPLQ